MKKRNRFLALFMVLCGLMPFSHAEKATEGSPLRLYCLNIGKADCMLLLYHEKAYLIDTGYAHTYAALETALQALSISHLDGVFLTHCHQDHEGGLMPLAKSEIGIGHFYAAALYHEVKEEKHPAVLAAKERNMQVEFLHSGDSIKLDEQASFSVLGPVYLNEDNENNNSLVLHFTSPEGSLLLCGDMKNEEENDLLYHRLLSPADVLKCGHHGDNNATSMALLRAVRPRHALILTHSGEERDTPSGNTLHRLYTMGCQVHCTQDARDALCVSLQNGQVTVEDVAWPGIPLKIEGITASVSLPDDTITITNTGRETARLTGCILYSSKGDDVFDLPDIALAPGESYVIGNKYAKDADWKLDKKSVWHDKKRDVAILYDAYGRILATDDNGLKEN